MENFMDLAIDKAHEGKTPFGAVIVQDKEVLSAVYNTTSQANDPTAHAEVNAIRQACQYIGGSKLQGTVLYTTCEPCPMCAAAAFFAGIQDIYYGASIPTISQYLPQMHLRAKEVLLHADVPVGVEQMKDYAKTCEVLLRQYS